MQNNMLKKFMGGGAPGDAPDLGGGPTALPCAEPGVLSYVLLLPRLVPELF